jgi:hypothetical protein
MMGGTIEFLVKYGYIVVFVGVFAEQIGLPFPSAPMLMAAGALVGFRRLNVFEALTLAARAKRANLLFHRSGEPFWQDESYDHLVRKGEEIRRVQYIENNPLAACLADKPELYEWSSAERPERPPQAGGLPRGLPHHTQRGDWLEARADSRMP